MSTTQHNDVILTIAEEKELALMDTDGDDRISAEEARAAVKSSAKLSVSTSRLWKIVAVVNFMVAVANLMMEDFMQAVVKLSKELLNGAAPTVAEPATALIEPDAVLAEHHAALAQPGAALASAFAAFAFAAAALALAAEADPTLGGRLVRDANVEKVKGGGDESA